MNRELLGGTWYFRQDDTFVGEQRALVRAGRPRRLDARSPSRHNWNATDTTENKPHVGWYRKEFTLPALAEERRSALLEGPLRGQQLPHQGVAERQAARPVYTGYFPFEVLLKNLKQGPQHARRRGLLAAQQLRPHALAPGRVQRLRHRRLVELRRASCARSTCGSVDTVDVEDVQVLPRLRRVGGAGQGRGAHDRSATSRSATATCRSSCAWTASGSGYDPETVPALGRRELSTTVDDQEAAPVGAARARAVRHDGRRAARTASERQHLPASPSA